MARLAMTTSHHLGKEEAQRRLKTKLIFVRGKYGRQVSGLQDAWKENVLSFDFKAVGMKVAGTMEVEEGEVRLAAQVPLGAVFFKKLIEQKVLARNWATCSPERGVAPFPGRSTHDARAWPASRRPERARKAPSRAMNSKRACP